MVATVKVVNFLVKKMTVLAHVVILMVENAGEVAQDQDAVVQSAEVDPVDVEDIKVGSLFVLFFAYLSDK